MQTSTPKQPETKQTEPIEPSGTIRIAGRQVSVGTATVQSEPVFSPKTFLKGLKEVSKKSPFPQPTLLVNE